MCSLLQRAAQSRSVRDPAPSPRSRAPPAPARRPCAAASGRWPGWWVQRCGRRRARRLRGPGAAPPLGPDDASPGCRAGRRGGEGGAPGGATAGSASGPGPSVDARRGWSTPCPCARPGGGWCDSGLQRVVLLANMAGQEEESPARTKNRAHLAFGTSPPHCATSRRATSGVSQASTAGDACANEVMSRSASADKGETSPLPVRAPCGPAADAWPAPAAPGGRGGGSSACRPCGPP